MQESTVVELVEEAIQAIPGSAAGKSLTDLEGWDSMGMVIFVELVAKRSGVELAVHDVRACGTLAELAEHIASRAEAG